MLTAPLPQTTLPNISLANKDRPQFGCDAYLDNHTSTTNSALACFLLVLATKRSPTPTTRRPLTTRQTCLHSTLPLESADHSYSCIN